MTSRSGSHIILAILLLAQLLYPSSGSLLRGDEAIRSNSQSHRNLESYKSKTKGQRDSSSQSGATNLDDEEWNTSLRTSQREGIQIVHSHHPNGIYIETSHHENEDKPHDHGHSTKRKESKKQSNKDKKGDSSDHSENEAIATVGNVISGSNKYDTVQQVLPRAGTSSEESFPVAVNRSIDVFAIEYTTSSDSLSSEVEYLYLVHVTETILDGMFSNYFETDNTIFFEGIRILSYKSISPRLIQFEISTVFLQGEGIVVPSSDMVKNVLQEGLSESGATYLEYLTTLEQSPFDVFSTTRSFRVVTDPDVLHTLIFNSLGGPENSDGEEGKPNLLIIFAATVATLSTGVCALVYYYGVKRQTFKTDCAYENAPVLSDFKTATFDDPVMDDDYADKEYDVESCGTENFVDVNLVDDNNMTNQKACTVQQNNWLSHRDVSSNATSPDTGNNTNERVYSDEASQQSWTSMSAGSLDSVMASLSDWIPTVQMRTESPSVNETRSSDTNASSDISMSQRTSPCDNYEKCSINEDIQRTDHSKSLPSSGTQIAKSSSHWTTKGNAIVSNEKDEASLSSASTSTSSAASSSSSSSMSSSSSLSTAPSFKRNTTEKTEKTQKTQPIWMTTKLRPVHESKKLVESSLVKPPVQEPDVTQDGQFSSSHSISETVQNRIPQQVNHETSQSTTSGSIDHGTVTATIASYPSKSINAVSSKNVGSPLSSSLPSVPSLFKSNAIEKKKPVWLTQKLRHVQQPNQPPENEVSSTEEPGKPTAFDVENTSNSDIQAMPVWMKKRQDILRHAEAKILQDENVSANTSIETCSNFEVEQRSAVVTKDSSDGVSPSIAMGQDDKRTFTEDNLHENAMSKSASSTSSETDDSSSLPNCETQIAKSSSTKENAVVSNEKDEASLSSASTSTSSASSSSSSISSSSLSTAPSSKRNTTEKTLPIWMTTKLRPVQQSKKLEHDDQGQQESITSRERQAEATMKDLNRVVTESSVDAKGAYLSMKKQQTISSQTKEMNLQSAHANEEPKTEQDLPPDRKIGRDSVSQQQQFELSQVETESAPNTYDQNVPLWIRKRHEILMHSEEQPLEGSYANDAMEQRIETECSAGIDSALLTTYETKSSSPMSLFENDGEVAAANNETYDACIAEDSSGETEMTGDDRTIFEDDDNDVPLWLKRRNDILMESDEEIQQDDEIDGGFLSSTPEWMSRFKRMTTDE